MENQEITNSAITSTAHKSFFERMTLTNRIIMIVSYSIIAALIITTIILAVVPTYTGAKFNSTPDRVVIKSESQTLTLYEDTESTRVDFYRVWDAYNNSSSPVVIETIFNGYAGKGMTAVYDTQSSKSYGSLANATTYSVTFYWDEKQLMTDKDGKQFTYELSNGTQVTDPVYYVAATFAVSQGDQAKYSYFYLRRDTAATSSTTTRFYYTAYGNYVGLYNVLQSLYDEGKFSV